MAPRNDVPAYVLGVGLTKFIKPRAQRNYPEMGYEAGVKAMLDAQINYDDVETGVACYCYGDTTSGQRIFYQFGMSSYVLLSIILTYYRSNSIRKLINSKYPNIQYKQCLCHRLNRPSPRPHPHQERRRGLRPCDRLRANATRLHQIRLVRPPVSDGS